LKKHYNNNFIKFGKEYWIGLSFMVPESADMKESDDDDVNIYHMQIHGDGPGAPNFGLQVHNAGPPFKHQFQWIGEDKETHKTFLSGDVKLGKYEDFVLNVKFEKSKSGFFHLYRNGKKVLSKTDTSTAFTDESGQEPYLKVGAYVNKPMKYRSSKTKEWEVYYRAMRVAEGSSKFNDVDTRCNSPPAPTPQPSPASTPRPTA